MENSINSIKNRLDTVFIEKMAFAVYKLSDEQRSKSLLRDCIGMQARDLLKLFTSLNFDKYDCLLEYIISKTGEKNVN